MGLELSIYYSARGVEVDGDPTGITWSTKSDRNTEE